MLLEYRKRIIRNAILKGVVRENRRVFGNEPLVRARSWWGSYAGKGLVLAAALILLLFGNTGMLDSTQNGAYEYLPGGALGDAAVPADAAGLGSFEGKLSAEAVEPLPLETAPLALPDGSLAFPVGPGKTRDPLSRSPRFRISEPKTISLRQVFGLDVKTIVIDPGHGGDDPGTSGKMGLQEKTVALDVARRLKAKLDGYGKYNVLLTRYEDVTMSLQERIDFANANHADLFISVHVNYLPSRPNNIIETYYFGLAENESVLELALLENADSMVGLNAFKEIGEKLGGTLKLEESQRLASSIQKSLFTNISRDDKTVLDMGIKQAPFLVIMGTEMPGVLAEVTCLSNKQEEEKLRKPAYRENIAAYLESGILNYLNKGDYIYEARRR